MMLRRPPTLLSFGALVAVALLVLPTAEADTGRATDAPLPRSPTAEEFVGDVEWVRTEERRLSEAAHPRANLAPKGDPSTSDRLAARSVKKVAVVTSPPSREEEESESQATPDKDNDDAEPSPGPVVRETAASGGDAEPSDPRAFGVVCGAESRKLCGSENPFAQSPCLYLRSALLSGDCRTYLEGKVGCYREAAQKRLCGRGQVTLECVGRRAQTGDRRLFSETCQASEFFRFLRRHRVDRL